MSELILVKPSEEHLDELLSFKREFTGRGERVAETCTELSALLAGYKRSRDGIGRSQSAVYRFARGEDVRYLKVAELSNEIRRERDLIARLGRQLDLCLDPGKPRRIRTRSARYAACLAESLGFIERPPRCAWCRGGVVCRWPRRCAPSGRDTGTSE